METIKLKEYRYLMLQICQGGYPCLMGKALTQSMVEGFKSVLNMNVKNDYNYYHISIFPKANL